MNQKSSRTARIAVAIITLSLPVCLRAQTSTPGPAPSNKISTGFAYAGIDLGITGTSYFGQHNFIWTLPVPDQTVPWPANDATLRTYLPFTNLGIGAGFVGGIKIAVPLGGDFDLEAKARYMINHTSQTQSSDALELDPYKPNATANSTSSYALSLYNLDFGLLAHVRLNDRFYAAAGADIAPLLANGFSADQSLTGGNSYLRQNVHTQSFIYSLSQPRTPLTNTFASLRTGIDVGVGGVERIGASNVLLDIELLVSIPLTEWMHDYSLQAYGVNALNATTAYFNLPAITYPHLWYATLTLGVRLPFSPLPPPIVPIVQAPPLRKDSLSMTTIVPKRDSNGLFRLAGRVIDAKTGKPVAANLTAVDLSNNTVIGTARTDSNGNYSLRVNGAGKYSVTADANGYLFGTAYFEVDSAGRILRSHPDIALSGTSGGRTRLLVFFDFDKADLQPASSPELNRAVELMKAVPTLKVEIAGYTDSVGTAAHNMELSVRRANAVRDFMVQHGIAPERITAKGYGTATPIASNTTDEGRAENRRVEFVVLER